jgi:type IV pilus assembly protein PilA
MQQHPTHKSVEGFTLIELLILIAIIGILAAIAIPQFNQYKIRGYDAQTKQALKDMHLLCNAYWLDTSALRGCDLPKIEEPTYGFNQNADVVATLPSLPRDNFCASAKHNDSPNTFSIDSASLISSGSDCSGTGGSVQTASVSPLAPATPFEEREAQPCCGFTAAGTSKPGTNHGELGPPSLGCSLSCATTYTPSEEACKQHETGKRRLNGKNYGPGGIWILVDADGRPIINTAVGGMVTKTLIDCSHYDRLFYEGGHTYVDGDDELGERINYCMVDGGCPNSADRRSGPIVGSGKLVYAHPNSREHYLNNPDHQGVCNEGEGWTEGQAGNACTDFSTPRRPKNYFTKYDFATGTWSNAQGEKFKNGERVMGEGKSEGETVTATKEQIINSSDPYSFGINKQCSVMLHGKCLDP